jgi:transcriptional regulator with XRE-family HTH domain
VDKKLASKFGQVLKKERLKQQISQEELAFECSLDRTYISMLERGIRQPTLETIFKLAKALRLTPSVIVKKVEQTT